MDPLNAAAMMSSRLLSQRQAAMASAILAVGTNPSVDSITAMNQAQILFEISIGVMKNIESAYSIEGAQLVQMMESGQNINLFG